MKVAIATKNKVDVFEGSFQFAPFFAVIELLTSKPFTEEIRENTFLKSNGKFTASDIIHLIHDCDIAIGSQFDIIIIPLLLELKKDFYQTTWNSVDEILDALGNGIFSEFTRYDRDSGEFVNIR